MRLSELLATLPDDQLERLGIAHLGEDEKVTRASLCTTLESVLRSYSFVRKFVSDRFPPTFSIFETLLDSEEGRCPAGTFREQVTARTQTLVQRVASGDLLERDSTLRLYRRVLLEARRNDLVLDASETAILGVLRRELNIRSVEHFLIEHHSDFYEFWSRETSFLDEMNSLRSNGLVFGYEGSIVIAEEVVPLIRQTLGFEMRNTSKRRLFERISGIELGEALGKCGLKTSGSRDEKLERLLASYVQPGEVLRTLSLQTLRDLARDSKATVSGSKDEMVDRLVNHYLHDLDVAPAQPDLPPPIPEQRVLNDQRFRALFSALKGDDLTDILAGIESSRITGSKDIKVSLIVESIFSELSLLKQLTNKALEDALSRNRLRITGSKRERIDRLIEFFATAPEALLFRSDSALDNEQKGSDSLLTTSSSFE